MLSRICRTLATISSSPGRASGRRLFGTTTVDFWIFFPLPDEGIYLTTAVDPAGRWSEPHLVQPGYGLIDPCPLWDDDGSAYLVYAYAKSRAGIKDKLRVRPMAPDGSRLLGEGKIVFDEPERHPTIEGPKFLKRDGWYYILAPGGGVDTGWQVVLRSRHIYGPYEDCVVLEQGSTSVNGPHQGALVDTPGGEWWFLHFQDAGVYGRISHLQPVEWADGWPLIGRDYDGNGIGEPVPLWRKPDVGRDTRIAVPATSDAFTSERLGLQWQWSANHREGLVFTGGTSRSSAAVFAAGYGTTSPVSRTFSCKSFRPVCFPLRRPWSSRQPRGMSGQG